MVLEALWVKGGAEDTRSLMQRQHDALQEAFQRLIESGMLPGDGSSQPVQVSVHVDLAELRGLPAPRNWSAAGPPPAPRRPGSLDRCI